MIVFGFEGVIPNGAVFQAEGGISREAHDAACVIPPPAGENAGVLDDALEIATVLGEFKCPILHSFLP